MSQFKLKGLSDSQLSRWFDDLFISGVDVLGDKKKRRDSWNMGYKGDYMDFQNNKSLQSVISTPKIGNSLSFPNNNDTCIAVKNINF